MKLTMERVRALRAAMSLAAIGTTEEEREEAHFDVALALCDEWIAANCCKWFSTSLLFPPGVEVRAYVEPTRSNTWRGVWQTLYDRTTSAYDTEPEARAWLEEQARAAGYEVPRG